MTDPIRTPADALEAAAKECQQVADEAKGYGIPQMIADTDKHALIAKVGKLTQAAVDAGKSYTVRFRKDGAIWIAVVQVEGAE